MAHSSDSGTTEITPDALRQVADLNHMFRTTLRNRACEIAAKAGFPPVVTSTVLKEAVLGTCAEIRARIHSEPDERGQERKAA